MEREQQLVVVRGAGDLATGVIWRLHRCGYPVLVLESEFPSAIRRRVAFSEAVYDGMAVVEGILCVRVSDLEEAKQVWGAGNIPLLTDPEAKVLEHVRPWALVDAIIAKKNLGTNRKMAPKTIALGPGFEAGRDVDLVIETMRGHQLGRILESGTAAPNTGIPGLIGGYGKERVMHSPCRGIFLGKADIGDFVEKDQVIGVVVTGHGEIEVKASLSGLLRGVIRAGYPVEKGTKIADIDPRKEEYDNCFTISDKARCLAGSVLEGLLYLEAREERSSV